MPSAQCAAAQLRKCADAQMCRRRQHLRRCAVGGAQVRRRWGRRHVGHLRKCADHQVPSSGHLRICADSYVNRKTKNTHTQTQCAEHCDAFLQLSAHLRRCVLSAQLRRCHLRRCHLRTAHLRSCANAPLKHLGSEKIKSSAQYICAVFPFGQGTTFL